MKYIIGMLFASAIAYGATNWGNLTVKGNLAVTGTQLFTGASTFTAAPTFSAGTATTVPYLNGSKVLTSSAVTPTELGYLSGVTSSLCGINQSCTLTGKTLTAPIIATISNTGTLTLPTSTDTLVGKATTDVLTNKTLTAPAINGANLNFGTASNTNRLLLPSDTTTNLDALTDTAALIAYDTTLNKVVYNNGASWGQLGAGTGGGSAGINILSSYNPGAEDGAVGTWTETGGGTLTTTSTAANVGNGSFAFSYDASANTDHADSSAVTIPAGLFGKNCLLDFYYKGFDANITAQVHDGTNVVASQALAAATTYTRFQLNFVCPSSGTLQMRLLAGADAAIGYWDEVHLGSATNVVSGLITTEWASYTPTTNGLGTVASVEMKWRRIGDSIEIAGNLTTGTTTASEARVGLPSGLTSAAISNIRIAGVTFPDNVDGGSNISALSTLIEPSVTYLTFGFRNGASAPLTKQNGSSIFANSTRVSINALVPISGWTASTSTVSIDTLNWRVDANISGANPDLGTSDQASYTGIENGSLTLTNNTGDGVLTAQIPCSSTNASSGTTCSAGNESVGVAFNIPRAGAVRACANFSHAWSTGASGVISAAFQIVETPNNAQTISQEGKSRIMDQINTASISGTYPHQVCGTFNFSSAGQKTLRLFYEQDVTATVNSNLVIGDALSTVGQRDIHWEVYPIDQQMPMPSIIGNSWYINANISGANPSLGVAAVTAYTEIIDAGLTMTPISGSAAVGIMCSSTNAATAPTTSTSTCAAGSESLGANFALPEPGVYEVCVQASWLGIVDTAEQVHSTFEIIETPTNAQTLTLEGGTRTQLGVDGMTIATGTDQGSYQILNTCSLFNWKSASAGTIKGVRLMYEQSVSGSPDVSQISMDANTNNGQRDLNIRVRKYANY